MRSPLSFDFSLFFDFAFAFALFLLLNLISRKLEAGGRILRVSASPRYPLPLSFAFAFAFDLPEGRKPVAGSLALIFCFCL
jgi:hypothetical protein